MAERLAVEFCGTWTTVDADAGAFSIGRDADLDLDDNPYLHRRFLELRHDRGLWWIANVGDQLAATITDGDGRVQTWLAPGASIPIVFASTEIRFTAGPTTYELTLALDYAPMAVVEPPMHSDGTTTLGRLSLTASQKLLLIALAEPALRDGASAPKMLPSSAEAARRLDWPITTFNRKLDNVCQKFAKAGVQGLHGGMGNAASHRKARLVEYALAVRLVTADDLHLLEVGAPPE